MSVATSSWRKLINHNVFQLLLETTASGIILEWAIGNDSESVHIAVPHKPQITYIRAPSHPGSGRVGVCPNADSACSGHATLRQGVERIVTANMWAVLHGPSSLHHATSVDTARHSYRSKPVSTF